ncbi:MAG: hypothetical protein COA79_20250 [Planctomycetota bacterium]|nr:MAG: hypothetical protein COA79_20250 [Planctomycetota bacterium]
MPIGTGKRGRILIIGTGMQEIGKSYLTLEDAMYQAYTAQYRQKSLLFDSNGEYAEYEIGGVNYKINKIGHNDIIAYGNHPGKEVKRIEPFHKDGAPMDEDQAEALLLKVIKDFRGGHLIIEDTSTLFGDFIPEAVAKLIVNVRHRNCDITMHLQSVGRILPKMLQNAKVIRYHYQLDAIDRSRAKLSDEIEIYQVAEKMVNTQFIGGNPYFCVYIFRVFKKIKGRFTPRMMAEAIQEYLSENPVILRPLLLKTTTGGGKLYTTHEEALAAKTKELFAKYWGN